MAKKTLIVFYIISLLLCFSIVQLFWGVNTQTIHDYNTLVYNKEKSEKSPKQQTINQYRQNVQKDIYAANEHSRLHHTLKSKNSFLSIAQKNEKIDLQENLSDFFCIIQESSDIHQVKFITAEKGTYSFPSQKFYCENIFLEFYKVPEKELLPQFQSFSPFLKGSAKDLSFKLSKKVPEFEASNFKAFLNTEEKND
ncbi:MAG TPA: hypothetical protein P5048_00165 [Chlamydiales bacterium]|nr:hypothetical protein [Chlamydiales bacterium]